MPFRQQYFPAPQDRSLPVYHDLPPEYVASRFLDSHNATIKAEHYGEGKEQFMHYCRYCLGWIPGQANEFPINTMSHRHPLGGRQGTEYYCRRCGEQIGFSGIVS